MLEVGEEDVINGEKHLKRDYITMQLTVLHGTFLSLVYFLCLDN